MFNKITITNNKIQIMRYIVEWREEMPSGDESESKIMTFSQQMAETSLLEEMLRNRNIPYTVTRIDVPAEMEQYDGMDWTAGWDNAVAMINGDPSHKIAQLKQALAEMDYKTSKYADGEYTQGEWDAIKSERKELRRRIHELEA